MTASGSITTLPMLLQNTSGGGGSGYRGRLISLKNFFPSIYFEDQSASSYHFACVKSREPYTFLTHEERLELLA
jgi:hypothetical protein